MTASDASSSAANETPFADLTPQAVLDALAAVGLDGDGRMIQLNSYENRVFQVFLESGEVVVPKFYRPGRWSDAQILEEHAFAAELAAREIPVVAPLVLSAAQPPREPVELLGAPPTLAHVQGQRVGVSPRRSGRAPELEDMTTLEWIGRFIGRIHAVGATQRFEHRASLDIETFGSGACDYLLANDWVAPEALPAWRAAIDTALSEVRRAFDALPDLRTLRLHGDCHPGNILWTDAGPHFVDLDDALTGPAVQDLWMLLSGDRASMTRQLGAVLAGYEDFMDFDWRELRLVEPLRTLRLIHHSAWIARRWSDPAFPVAFPWFAGPAYWGQQTIQLNEQIEAMREAPLFTA
ncbi:MAG TPA: serine/threonine protein kinase [Burkholderiaceae bacterium]|nr:serine/threonine protein kinase [Burkholderiaceae bacterium]